MSASIHTSHPAESSSRNRRVSLLRALVMFALLFSPRTLTIRRDVARSRSTIPNRDEWNATGISAGWT